MLDEVKNHLVRNKTRYLVFGGAVIGTAVGMTIGYFVFRNVDIQAQAKAQVIGLINFKSPAIATAIVVPQGHPGYVVQCVETGEVFMSQNQAAQKLGVNPSVLSGHLNGKFESAGGKTFIRLGVAQVGE